MKNSNNLIGAALVTFSPLPVLARIALLATVVTSAGCAALFGDDGLFPSKQSDYLEAKSSEPLTLPEGAERAATGDAYPIPALEFSSVLPEKFVIPRVDALGELESRGSVRIQRLVDDRWILVNRSPTQTWPLVLEFLGDNQVDLALASVEQGTIETQWLREPGQAEGVLEKYRFVLNAGIQSDTTEVLVKQLQGRGGDKFTEQDWKKSSDLEREENMTKLLAQFLASSPDSVSHSLLAQGLSTANKASIQYDEVGRPYILLQLPYQRGWASLGLALGKADFSVADINRDEGLYYANFDPTSKKRKKRSWLARTLFPRPDRLESVRGEYRIFVQEQADAEQLVIMISRDGEGQEALANNEQAFLLNRILLQLS